MPPATSALPTPPRAGRPRLALATYAAHPALEPDDERLAEALRAGGAHAEAAVWNDAAVDWAAFDAVVVRTPWDYHRAPAAFRAWLDALEAGGVPVVNPPAALRWNMDKRYLRALAARGVPVVPTRWVEPGDPAPLDAILAAEGWDDAVVKPAVSAGAFETWRTSRATAAADAPRLAALVAAVGPVLVQPFQPEIVRDGEWSLLYFGGAFSHALVKRAVPGEFRVQMQFGGVATPQVPAPAVLEAAARVLDAAAACTGVPRDQLAYARVDGCVVDGALRLMELEMVEPALFLHTDPAAAARAAAALLEAVAAGRPG